MRNRSEKSAKSVS
jgi:hypothetical protein